MDLSQTRLHWADLLVIVLYFAAIMAVGIWSSLKNRGSVGGYFLAGRTMHWIPVGASLFASNIGSGHFVGLAGSGAAGGIGVASFELTAVFILVLLGWVFVPVYTAAEVYTMPEYLTKRFGGCRIRIYLSMLALILYIFTKISADLYAGALFVEQSMHLNLYIAIMILLVVAALFTITGGLTAVIWTDFAQTIIMIIGALVLMILSLVEVGGYQKLIDLFPYAIPNTTLYSNTTECGLVTPTYMHLVRPHDDPNYPWTGMFIGLPLTISIWYWCSDQVIVQRALAAKSISHVKGGVILAAYLKFLPFFLLVLPGMAARILFPDTVGCSDPEVCQRVCQSPQGCTNIAYSELVIKLMPNGARGFMLAVMMAALMSSLTSVFNSASTLFTMDVWRRLRQQAPEVELLIVGRVFILVLVAISIVWVPIIQNSQGTNLFDYIQAVQSFLAPPVCAVYILAVLVKRVNEAGAFWGLMSGMVVGLIRFAWQYSYSLPVCGESDPAPAIITKVHYLNFALVLFGISCAVTLVVSLMTPPIDEKHLRRLTFFDRFNELPPEPIPETTGLAMGNACCCMRSEKTDSEERPPETAVERQSAEDSAAQQSMLRRAINWLCGIEHTTKNQPAVVKVAPSIEEKPNLRRLCAVNAAILLSIAVGVVVFYS